MNRFTSWVARATAVATFGAMVGLIGGATGASASELEPSATVAVAAPAAECKDVPIKVTVSRGELPLSLRASKWAVQPPETLEFSGTLTLAVDNGGKLSGSAFKGLEALMKFAVGRDVLDASNATRRAISFRRDLKDDPAFRLEASKGLPDEFDRLFTDCRAKVSGSAYATLIVVELIPTPQALTPYKEGQRWTIEYSGTWVANP